MTFLVAGEGASLAITNGQQGDPYNLSVNCHFRVMQEESRYHYALLFFCPNFSEGNRSTMRAVSHNQTSSRVDLVVTPFGLPKSKLDGKIIESSFVTHASALPPRVFVADRSMREPLKRFNHGWEIQSPLTGVRRTQPWVGVCGVHLHQSSIREMRAIHDAILKDWIRYYSGMGMAIFLYDNYGGRYRDYMESVSNLNYFGHTIGELVIPKSFTRNLGFDNSNPSLSANRIVFNEDKVMTLNHCRFDARAKYSIQKIIVVDTDEFLYCGSGIPKVDCRSQEKHR